MLNQRGFCQLLSRAEQHINIVQPPNTSFYYHRALWALTSSTLHLHSTVYCSSLQQAKSALGFRRVASGAFCPVGGNG